MAGTPAFVSIVWERPLQALHSIFTNTTITYHRDLNKESSYPPNLLLLVLSFHQALDEPYFIVPHFLQQLYQQNGHHSQNLPGVLCPKPSIHKACVTNIQYSSSLACSPLWARFSTGMLPPLLGISRSSHNIYSYDLGVIGGVVASASFVSTFASPGANEM